ncbi:MAG: conjugal transfer protein TraN [Chlamydiales bacterium]|nr:conjugal transfer protein TraN [Chlamydiales bacterium]
MAILFYGSFLLECKEVVSAKRTKELMELTKEEALDFGEEMAELLRKGLKKENPEKGTLNFSPDDFLSESDKGKQFYPQMIAQDTDVQLFLEASAKQERLEGSEDLFTISLEVSKNPQRELEIVSETTDAHSEKERFETCQERGSYQMSVTQTLRVEVVPEVTQKLWHCKGHKEEKSYYWKYDAEHYFETQTKKLSKDSTLLSYDVCPPVGGKLTDYVVVSKWMHKDGIACKKSWDETQVIQASAIIDRWEADDYTVLSTLEATPHCRMLYSQVISGPETRSFNGAPIFRDCWQRRLFFACDDDRLSKCARLRELGGRIYQKKCLKTVSFNENECDLWEKTYRMAGEKIHQETQLEFSGDHLWGFEHSFDSSYQGNEDFGSAVTTLAIFADMKEEFEDSNVDFRNKKSAIFSGIAKECRRSFIENVLFDCCSKMDGFAVASKLCHCNAVEKDLAVKRDEGKCHYVGTYKKNLNTEKVQTYCCFPTRLARVIQEEGRKQLGMEWGTPESPKCSGFTVNQMRSLDFTQIDLSEVIDDLQVDKEWIQNKIKNVTRDLESGAKKGAIAQKMDHLMQKEREKVYE